MIRKKPFSLPLLVLLFSISCTSPIQSPKVVQKATISQEKQATTRSPLYESFDNGETWQPTGNDLPEDTQVSFLKKIGQQLIMATDNQGLFLSDANKTTWTSIGDGLPNKKINALHIFENEIYAGVYRAGIYFSSDFGRNWVSLNFDLPDLRVGAILKTKNGLLVGTDSGVFQLLSQQVNWKQASEMMQITSLNQLGNKIVAGTNKGVLLSSEVGDNWEWIQQKGAVHNIAILEKKIIALYVSGDLYLSKDWGNTWTAGNYGPRMASYGYAAAIAANNAYIMSNNYGVHRSTDGGYNWKLIYKDEDKIFMDFLVDGTKIYAGTRAWKERRAKSILSLE